MHHTHSLSRRSPLYTPLENDHKSNIEFLEGSKKAQQEEIRRLKEDIYKLRAQLLRKVLLVFPVLAGPSPRAPPPCVLSLLLEAAYFFFSLIFYETCIHRRTLVPSRKMTSPIRSISRPRSSRLARKGTTSRRRPCGRKKSSTSYGYVRKWQNFDLVKARLSTLISRARVQRAELVCLLCVIYRPKRSVDCVLS